MQTEMRNRGHPVFYEYPMNRMQIFQARSKWDVYGISLRFSQGNNNCVPMETAYPGLFNR